MESFQHHLEVSPADLPFSKDALNVFLDGNTHARKGPKATQTMRTELDSAVTLLSRCCMDSRSSSICCP